MACKNTACVIFLFENHFSLRACQDEIFQNAPLLFGICICGFCSFCPSAGFVFFSPIYKLAFF